MGLYCRLQKGEITGKELAYDLGKNATGVAGSLAGSALAGAAAGSIIPGAGTIVGFGVGLVGGMVGYAATTAAYKAALASGSEMAPELAKKSEQIAKEAIDSVKKNAPSKEESIQEAFRKFNKENDISIQI